MLSRSAARVVTAAGIALLATLFAAGPALAVTLDAVDRGWYREDGLHQPANTNYFVGDGQSQAPMRNFFVFDVSGVTGSVASAELQLLLPAGNFSIGFESDQGIETYTVFDFVGSAGDLVAGVNGVASYADLGSGVSYGSTTVTDADENTFVTITLDAQAVAQINSGSGLFVVGGAVTSLDADPDSTEWIFAMTEDTPTTGTTRLVVNPIPEPSAALAMATGLLVVRSAIRRRRRAPAA